MANHWAKDWAHGWARVVMGLIFVLATISSPVHVQAMPVKAHDMMTAATRAAAPATDNMPEACAKVMEHQAAKAKPHVPADHSACCADGCNCPFGHCPATPSLLASGITLPFLAGSTVLADRDLRTFVSFRADTLIRPPKG